MTPPTLVGISMTAVVVIGGGVLVNTALNPPVNSFDSAMVRLERRLLPSITVESAMSPAALASGVAPLPMAERLPQAAAFPLHGSPAGGITHSGNTLRVEIVSSLEKADNQRASGRWLVDAAERFNRRGERGSDGRRIEVVVRFLALLELFKQGRIDLVQAERFGDIAVVWNPDALADELGAIDNYDG